MQLLQQLEIQQCYMTDGTEGSRAQAARDVEWGKDKLT